MSQDHALDAALAAGAIIVTPNNRLARAVVQRHDAAQWAAGHTTWPAARALPRGAFVDTLWSEAIAQGMDAPPPLAGAASLHVWQTIVETYDSPLLDARGAAHAAAEAFRWFHEYREANESWPALAAGAGDDAATFARWVAAYRQRLRARGVQDRAELADRLVAQGVAWPEEGPIALLGFNDMSPQQRRLLEALAARGAAVQMLAPPRRAGARSRVECASPTDEIVRALEFARARAERSAAARVGIVVEDLAARRGEVEGLAEEILAPSSLVPLDTLATRAYGLSLGVALAQVPLVAAALDLIALATTGLDAMSAAALARSPYLPGEADAWHKRGYVERIWREQGRRTVRLHDLAGSLVNLDAALSTRLRTPLPRRRGTPREWVIAFTTWLDALGWPGSRALDSVEWQARAAWQELLVEFAHLGDVAGSLDAAAAFGALRTLAEERVWAPQSGTAPIQILGVLEAAGLEFDALWLAGFAADAWPPPPRPNPFLPPAWQRARGVPRASASRELDYAKRLTAILGEAADEVVASHARQVDDAPQVASPLVVGWRCDPSVVPDTRDAPARLRDLVAASAGPSLAAWQDDLGPALQQGADVRGGTGLVESQSTCPFQAFARYRLRAEEWTQPDEGLTPKERGNLLHHALKVFWDDARDHATLVSLDADALEARVAAAVDAARDKLPAARWRALARAIAAGEAERLKRAIVLWLTRHEMPRPPFAILDTEREARLSLGDLRLRFRIDRIDRVEPEGIAIIDYKSGRAIAPSAWFKPRPAGTQVGLYALAQRAEAPTRPVRAAAYAQIKASELRACGITDEHAWPGLMTLGKASAGMETWAEVLQYWAETLDGLAREFAHGEARVTPRDRQACERCDLQPLCRIRSVHHDPREPLPAETNDDE